MSGPWLVARHDSNVLIFFQVNQASDDLSDLASSSGTPQLEHTPSLAESEVNKVSSKS